MQAERQAGRPVGRQAQQPAGELAGQPGARPGDRPEALSALDRRILTGPDPFERNKVPSAWDAPLQADVPSIYAEQTERLLQLVEAVRADRITRAAIVSGQAGFGKTHLLGRVKARLPMPALFAYVTAFSDPERPYRHLLRALLASLEQPLAPHGESQLAAVVHALSTLDRRELVARYPGIDLDVVRALQLLSGRRWELARTWLAANDMDPADLRKLGLRRTLSTEQDVATAIVTLARVLSHWGPVVVAFDQLEFLANGPTEPGLSILGNRLAWLHDEAPNLLLVLACLDTTYAETATLWRQSVRDRLAANLIGLTGLTAEQAQQLCDLRMRALYGEETPPWPAYPFRHEFFAELFQAGAAGPRAVLMQCSRALRELRALGRVIPIAGAAVGAAAGGAVTVGAADAGAPSTASRVREALRRELQERIQERRREGRGGAQAAGARPGMPADAARLARTLQLLLEAFRRTGRALGGWRVKRAELEPGPVRGQPPVVAVWLERDGKPLHVGIAVVDTPSGQSFARQLQALANQLRDGRWERGVVLRERRLGVPRTWKKGHEYVQQWKAAGGAVAEVGEETVAHLDAIWSLMADAESGDVAPLGAPVDADEVLEHVVEDAAAGSPALDDLVEALQQVAGTAVTTTERASGPAAGPVQAAATEGRRLPEARRAPWVPEQVLSFSVSEAVSALACPRYFILSGGRRPFAGGLSERDRDRVAGPAVRTAGSPELEAATVSDAGLEPSPFPPSYPLGTAFHRLVAGFVSYLRPAVAGSSAVPVGGSRPPFPGEDAWVAVARRTLFDMWRRTEGRSVPEQDAQALWAMTERAVRFLCRTVADAAQERSAARGWWPLRGRRRKVEVAAEIPLERAFELDEGRRVRIAGVADVVVRAADGREIVIEFKTYSPPDEPLDLFQVALYTWMLEGRRTPQGRRALRPAEPVLVYVTPDATVVRRFEPGLVTDTIERKLRPFVAELEQWVRWQVGDPAPPATRLPGLCQRCAFHPPCPEVFPLDLSQTGGEPGQVLAPAPEAAAPKAVAGAVPAAVSQAPPPAAVPGMPTTAPAPAPEELPVAPEALEEALRQFGCDVRTVGVVGGPSFVRYLMAPESRTTVERIRARAEDLLVRLRLPSEPMVDSLSGAIAIDVARHAPRVVPLEEVLKQVAAPAGGGGARQGQRGVVVPLGVGIEGRVEQINLADPATPHLLVAGATGSGKSNLLLAMLAALGARYTPEQVRLLLIDPKQVTFGPLAGSPYLLRPPVLDPGEVPQALDHLLDEMNARNERMTRAGVQSIDEWAERTGTPAPHVLCMVDEFSSLVLTSKKERDAFERRIHEIANKGRAAGIHLVLATQRPDSTVVSGTIKNNLTVRIALKVGNRASSQVILDQPGAQALAGKGEMLFSSGSGRLLRLQAPYVTLGEVQRRLQVPR